MHLITPIRTLLALALVGALVALVAATRPSPRAVAPRHTTAPAARSAPVPRSHPRVVVALAPGQSPPAAAAPAEAEPVASAAPAPTDAQIRSDLAAFRRDIGQVTTVRGVPGQVTGDGTAVVPIGAPPVVAAVVAAANEIATKPYKWGGGHGAWRDTGYDCSGSLSFALAGAGLLNSPLTSTGFESFGDPGPGRWITIFANGTHTWMIVGGLRFDTSGAAGSTRWQSPRRSTDGFTVRHPHGL